MNTDNDLLNESMGKFNEFASAAKSTLAAQDWGTWSKQSRPIASFTCLGLSVVTLFLFGHFFGCLYAFAVGLFIGIFEIEWFCTTFPMINVVKDPLVENGIESLAGRGCMFVFASFPFFNGSMTPLYIAGVVVLLSGITHLLEIFTNSKSSSRENDSLTDYGSYANGNGTFSG